jgi:hypothetical protein
LPWLNKRLGFADFLNSSDYIYIKEKPSLFISFPVLKVSMNRLSLVLASLIVVACSKENGKELAKTTVFRRLTAIETGLQFTNSVEPFENFDVFKYRNFYNGGGVAIADFDNDGLSDIYLTANMGGNKLFHNLGNWKFQDISEQAGVKGSKQWSTGVSVADVNADGLLDIYVCNAGDVEGGHRENELFINNGNLTFTEKAAEFGLDDNGYSTHAVFFDYDQDDDLDCYVLNNSHRPVSSLGYKNLRHIRDKEGGHRLYRNDDNRFIDVSESTGIYGSVIGFGLGACVGDVNDDGWLDIYVSNDLYERDYLYINNQKGGFNEMLEDYMGHISMFSMGGDMADLNNDGFPEIFSTDMLPEQNERLKTLIAFETYDVYQLRLQNGYYHQYLRNMLHMNNGGNGFLEVGEYAGVSATDWSWGSLIADFNNDGYKEIFVSNGIYKDIMDQDFVERLGRDEKIKKKAMEGKKVDFRPYLDEMPSIPLSNYLYEKKTGWQYENHSDVYGLDEPSFSNGAAYGDLDNDGDLDLIVNNVNQELFAYQNQTSQAGKNHALKINLIGSPRNKFGIGTVVKVFSGTEIIAVNQMLNRGFQSSMDSKIIIGVGSTEMVDSLVVEWPGRKFQIFTDVTTANVLHVNYAGAKSLVKSKPNEKPLLKIANDEDITHTENVYNEFDRDRLQYQMLSTQGPAFAQGDLTGDELDDFFVGGSVGYPGKIFIQHGNGKFTLFETNVFSADSLSEDTGAALFDADADGDLDLYVATGGVEYTGQAAQLQDRFYLNSGTSEVPKFEKTAGYIADTYMSGSCVRPADFDRDGDIDLFVGTRVIPGKYGVPTDQLLLQNNGRGEFREASQEWAPEMRSLGMVTDAVWSDVDADGLVDLIVVGEWMPITIFKNSGSGFVKQNIPGLQRTNGWWNVVRAADVDSDGDEDFVLGNNGKNSRFKPTGDSPLLLFVNDFDQNGSSEPIFGFSIQGKDYALAMRQDMVRQMSSMRKRFELYQDYADKSLPEILGKDMLEKSIRLKFHEAGSFLLINNGAKGFQLKPLPFEAQLAPVYGVSIFDVNMDSHLDLILGGNLFSVKPEVGRYDALRGLLLLGNGRGDFNSLTNKQSGLDLNGEVRHITTFKGKGKQMIAFIRNNASTVIYSVEK